MINMGLIVLIDNTMQTSTSAERNLLIYMVAVLLTFCSLIIIFFIVFQKRKNKLLLDKIKQQQLFDEEISKTQTEIQEQTLKHIGWELHDNVGQLLAYANMQLNMLSTQVEDKLKDKVGETTKTIAESLKEVRLLSKSLNNEVLLNNGFVSSIESELLRLKRMKFNSANLEVKGDIKPFTNKKHEIIIFRILQEFFSNSVKYSEAEHLKVELQYNVNSLRIIASDDGIGFDVETAEKGSGLINMKSRAQLINADFNLNSKPNQGVTLQLNYPL
jgi:signal transduction histidine kinase